MRYLTSSGFHVSMLPRGLRLVLSMYLAANLLGLVISSMKYLQRMDPTPASVQRYYQGEAAPPGEDLVMVPGESQGKSRRYLTDVSHPHLFTVPLMLLVIAHLAHLTKVSQRLLAGLDLGAFAGFFLSFGAPWLLPLAPAGMAWLAIIGGVSLTLCTAALCLIPLVAMWRPRPPRRDPTASVG